MLRGIGLVAKVATTLVVPLALGTGAFAVELNQQQVEEAARATSQIRSAVRAAVQECSSAECTQTRTRTRAKTRTKSKAMTQTKNRAKAAVEGNGQTTMLRDRDRDREQSKSCAGSQTQSQSGELNQNQNQNGDENGNGQAGSSGQGGSQDQNGSQNGNQNQNGSQNQNGRRAQAGAGYLSARLLTRDRTRTILRRRLRDGTCLVVAGVYIQKRDRDQVCDPVGDRQARDGHCAAA